jgi:hypothetical protein
MEVNLAIQVEASRRRNSGTNGGFDADFDRAGACWCRECGAADNRGHADCSTARRSNGWKTLGGAARLQVVDGTIVGRRGPACPTASW